MKIRTFMLSGSAFFLASAASYGQPAITAPLKPTTFAPMTQSVTDLLNGGWEIQSGSGEDATSLIMHKGQKWALCELGDGNTKVTYSTSPVSTCWALN